MTDTGGPRRSLWRRPSRVSLAAGVVGVLAGAGSVAAVDSGYVATDVGIALAVVGVVGVAAGALNHVLETPPTTPNAVPASVHAALASLARERFGSAADRRVYLPGDGGAPSLFVPDEGADGTLPTPETAPGTTVHPSGAELLAASERLRSSAPPADARAALAQATDAAAYGFSLASSVEVRDFDEGRAVVEADGVLAGDPTGYDHPLGSLLGVALAESTDGPVELTVEGGEEAVFTYRWE